MAFDTTFCTAHALASNTPQQSFTLITVGGSGGCPHFKIVWSGARNGIYKSLECLLVDMTLLQEHNKERGQFVIFKKILTLTQQERRYWPVLRCAVCWMSELRWCLPSWSSEPVTEQQKRWGSLLLILTLTCLVCQMCKPTFNIFWLDWSKHPTFYPAWVFLFYREIILLTIAFRRWRRQWGETREKMLLRTLYVMNAKKTNY